MSYFFFFNDTATTEIYTLSLHDALPISSRLLKPRRCACCVRKARHSSATRSRRSRSRRVPTKDRKSTRLNSSHSQISYAVFCLKKKKRRSLLMADKNSSQGSSNVPFNET